MESFASQLILKAYEHHKNHARFEETQRSWFLGAYLTFTGLLLSGVLNNFFKDGKSGPGSEVFLTALLGINLIVGICTAFAIMKVTGEFRRHNRQAEGMLKYVRENSVDKYTSDLLTLAMLDTATHTKGFNSITAFFSVAAMHNYIISLFVAVDIILGLFINGLLSGIASAATIYIIIFALAARLQHLYLSYVERQIAPPEQDSIPFEEKV